MLGLQMAERRREPSLAFDEVTRQTEEPGEEKGLGAMDAEIRYLVAKERMAEMQREAAESRLAAELRREGPPVASRGRMGLLRAAASAVGAIGSMLGRFMAARLGSPQSDAGCR